MFYPLVLPVQSWAVCVCTCVYLECAVFMLGKGTVFRCVHITLTTHIRESMRSHTGTAPVQEPRALIIDMRRKKWWQSNEIINVAELMMNKNKKSQGSLEPASSLAMQSHHILFWSRQAQGLFPSLP